MNDAHLHLLVNHFPIIGTIFGLGILITGIILKNNVIKNVAYVLFIISAIFAAVSMATGEGAEEIAENLPSVTDQLIHEHEEMAEKLALVLYGLGAVSLLGLFLNFRKHTLANLISYLVVIIAVAGVVLGKLAGTTGGEIRHTEIRSASSEAVKTTSDAAEDLNDED